MFLVKNCIILNQIYQKISILCYNLTNKECSTSWWLFFTYNLNVEKKNGSSTPNKLKINKNLSELSSKESTNTLLNNTADATSDSVRGPGVSGRIFVSNVIGDPNTRVHRSEKVYYKDKKLEKNSIDYITNKMAKDLRLTPPPLNFVPYVDTFVFYQNQIDQRYFCSQAYESNRNFNPNRISNKSLFNSANGQNPPKKLSSEEADKENVQNLRKWEEIDSTKNSRKGTEFTLLSYNVLAQDLLTEHAYLYRNHSPRACLWETRWKNLFEEIKSYDADIICFQEVQQSHIKEYYSQIDALGYGSVFKKRTGHRTDGCAFYYRKSKFKLLEHSTVEFNQNYPIVDRDNVGIIATLAPVANTKAEFVVATTHLLYNPRRTDVRVAQTQILLTEVERIAYKGQLGNKYRPVIITGDFNSEPDSAVYDLIVNGVLNYENRTDRTLLVTNNTNKLAGNVLIPPVLRVTDNCQHWKLVRNRRKGKKLSNQKELSLINLYHSEREQNQKSDNPEDKSAFSTGTLSHELTLKSVFKHTNGWEKEGTTYQNEWITVDYIFYSGKYNGTKDFEDGKLKLISRYTIPVKSQLKKVRNIPNFVLGSDHLALLSKFRLDD